MALIRWQPFREMDSLQRDMNRLFEAFAPMEQGSMQQSFMPLAEMEETDDAIHLKVEIPGMKADDLDVQVTNEAVTITGERKTESKSEKNGMKRSEFRYGRFNRTIPLSTSIDNTNVKGDYQDGILTLELPKLQKEENQAKKISLSSGRSKNLSESQAGNSNSESENASSKGISEVSAKEQFNTHDLGEPSAENVDVNTETGGYGNQDAWNDSQAATSQ